MLDDTLSKSMTLAVASSCSLSGYFVVWLPWRIALANETTRATNLVDGMQLTSIPLLFVVGLVAGLIVPQRFWLWGLFTMAAFPVVAVVLMVINPKSHSLWPIEFFIYGILTLPGVLGAGVGTAIRSKYSSKQPS